MTGIIVSKFLLPKCTIFSVRVYKTSVILKSFYHLRKHCTLPRCAIFSLPYLKVGSLESAKFRVCTLGLGPRRRVLSISLLYAMFNGISENTETYLTFHRNSFSYAKSNKTVVVVFHIFNYGKLVHVYSEIDFSYQNRRE